MAKANHKIPGEYFRKGVMLSSEVNPPALLDYIESMTTDEEDVFVCSYPKSGTMWLQEIVWLIMHHADVDLAKKLPNYQRIPFIEATLFTKSLQGGISAIENLPHPRVFKTHLRYDLMSNEVTSKAKMVVIMRNPKDTMVSYYHFYCAVKTLGKFTGSWAEFYEMFMSGSVKYGSWFDYTLSWYTHRNQPNILMVTYEGLKENPQKVICQIAEFLGQEMDEAQIRYIEDFTKFDNMKNTESTSYDKLKMDKQVSTFYRKGEVGDWKNYFTDEQNQHFDIVYKEKMDSATSELKFTY